ncbi:hypothetical protein Tco_1042828 [Tanacetum coccineum]|uniref:Uncharacterized protein n=1 Tax=Tanacetum coccineum TaxID=301880 RepID=A0ABQ5GMU9_9ASTR
MAVLESCPKHNMVAYLEKTDGLPEIHEINDISYHGISIHHALTVSPVVSTTFVEQFWTSAKSKIINNVRHITAKKLLVGTRRFRSSQGNSTLEGTNQETKKQAKPVMTHHRAWMKSVSH